MLEITAQVYPVQIYRANPAGVLVGWCDEPALAGSTAALEPEKSMLLFSSLPAFLPTPYLFLNIANYEQSTSEPMPFVTQLVQ